MSTLSDHTRNLDNDDRGALLFSAPNRYRNPQRSARATVMGRIRKTEKTDHAVRFHTMHPEAMAYSGFGDFDFYRMNIDRVHWVGGFAQARQVLPQAVQVDAVLQALAVAEIGGVVPLQRMNVAPQGAQEQVLTEGFEPKLPPGAAACVVPQIGPSWRPSNV